MARQINLSILNRQRTCAIDRRQLRFVVLELLAGLDFTEPCDLTIRILGELDMARANQEHLGHAGSTDVITLDYGEPQQPMVAEILVCADEAIVQSARFDVSWQEELTRYIVHALLHLKGYDDHRPADRRKMKRMEDAWTRTMARRFDLRKVGRKIRFIK